MSENVKALFSKDAASFFFFVLGAAPGALDEYLKSFDPGVLGTAMKNLLLALEVWQATVTNPKSSLLDTANSEQGLSHAYYLFKDALQEQGCEE